jgi:hypothetical protein
LRNLQRRGAILVPVAGLPEERINMSAVSKVKPKADVSTIQGAIDNELAKGAASKDVKLAKAKVEEARAYGSHALQDVKDAFSSLRHAAGDVLGAAKASFGAARAIAGAGVNVVRAVVAAAPETSTARALSGAAQTIAE